MPYLERICSITSLLGSGQLRYVIHSPQAFRLIDGNALKFDRRLCLVIHFATTEDHGGSSVKETAKARRERRIDLAFHHACHYARLLFAGTHKFSCFLFRKAGRNKMTK